MNNTVNMLLVFTALAMKITVQEDLKMDAASFSETLTANYEPHDVTNQETLIFKIVTPGDLSSLKSRCCTCFEHSKRLCASLHGLYKIRS